MKNKYYDTDIDYEDAEIPIRQESTDSIKTVKIIRRKKRTIKLWVWLTLFIILIIVIVILGLKVLNWSKDNLKTGKIIDTLDSDYELVEDNENTELINSPEDKESDYWYYITFPLINVDFKELKVKNSDTVAWINVNNTNINYPVVKTTNNDYYLEHSFDKSSNEAGWVFMDFRNNANLENKNTIIYAHSRLDKTMFGSLSKVLKKSWYENKDNHIIRISTPEENSLWQIFSVYVIEEETYYITTDFSQNSEYQDFLTTIAGRSKYDFNTSLDVTDKILTLSTCYSDTERTVVHAKLLKRELK